MIAFVIEHSKLIMIFLLIGIIIALASRPYRHETREWWRGAQRRKAPNKKRPRRSGAKLFL